MVYVNANPLPEPYVPSQYEDLSDFGPIQLSSGERYVNRILRKMVVA
jgi:hypothetical protein